MKHRSLLVTAFLVLPVAAAMAQEPPTPPMPPTPPAAPLPAVVPLPRVSGGYIDPIQLDDIRRASEDMRLNAEQIRINSQNFARQQIMTNVPFEFDSQVSYNFNGFQSFGDVGPRPAWMQGDPADSIYRAMKESVNRTDYLRAATQAADLLSKFPGSRYAPDAAYWEAFSRYRVGTLDQLHLALKTLDANTSRYDYMSRKSDVQPLRARILSALANRGDRDADDQLKKLYAQYPTICDEEAVQIRAQLLNSMYQSDPDGTLPTIRKQLESHDACSAQLRRTAVFLLANRPDEQKAAIIAGVAKNDTVREVRRQAIDMLSRMPGDAAITTLQDLMSDSDEDIQAAAVRSLMRSDNPRARAAMRSLIDRKDAPERQRVEAIQSYDRDNTTADDAAYLRGLYAREQSERVKDAIISALGRTNTEDNVNFLLAIARNGNESSSLRAAALNRISRTNLTTEDLGKLYDAADSRSMRRSIVSALGSRREEAAVSKLLDIVKFSTDPEIKTQAMGILVNRKDPEINKRLAAIINP